jgi:hypothetical protein
VIVYSEVRQGQKNAWTKKVTIIFAIWKLRWILIYYIEINRIFIIKNLNYAVIWERFFIQRYNEKIIEKVYNWNI